MIISLSLKKCKKLQTIIRQLKKKKQKKKNFFFLTKYLKGVLIENKPKKKKNFLTENSL